MELLILFNCNIKCQPILKFKNETKLENFFVYKNITFWLNIKFLINDSNQIIIAGSDTTTKLIHFKIQNSSNKPIDLYCVNPFSDSLHDNPMVTSFVQMKGNKYLLVFNKRYILNVIYNKSTIHVSHSMVLNKVTSRPFNCYYYYDGLYGIYPVSTMPVNKSCLYFGDSLSVSLLEQKKRNNIYTYSLFNPEFWLYGNSSYIEGKGNLILISNALRNELLILNLKNKEADTLYNIIPEFKELKEEYIDSINKKFPGNESFSRLNSYLNYMDSFNMIIKILLRSQNEIWIVWKGNDKNPTQIKLDILKYDSASFNWKTQYHNIIYDYKQMKETDTIDDEHFPINIFGNLNYLKSDQLLVLCNNDLDINPIGKTKNEFNKRKPKDTIKSLKLYEFIVINKTSTE
ncbi:MAG: hypothetical protein IT243_00400 [Bacteroidia bacterium]|nr:hypothetical protein [Bacteroidia bacterium]